MNLRTYYLKSKQIKKIAMENGLYEQVVMIRQRESDDKNQKENTKNITCKDNQKYQDVGLILIMSG